MDIRPSLKTDVLVGLVYEKCLNVIVRLGLGLGLNVSMLGSENLWNMQFFKSSLVVHPAAQLTV